MMIISPSDSKISGVSESKLTKRGLIRVFRVIYVNSLEELDTLNIGCHFTKNPAYSHDGGGGSNGLTQIKAIKLKITALANACDVNEDATLESNKEYPHEQEVVLKPNSRVYAEIAMIETATGIVNRKEWLAGEANTGTRYDEWVSEFI